MVRTIDPGLPAGSLGSLSERYLSTGQVHSTVTISSIKHPQRREPRSKLQKRRVEPVFILYVISNYRKEGVCHTQKVKQEKKKDPVVYRHKLQTPI